ncbi:preprotein translocase subunit SecE [Actinobacillus equuli]|nr:preprotein translocase subunit SecE [Actinobacillus equuli]
MATEIKKKTPEQIEEKGVKSKGVNGALWVVAIALLAVAAIGNAYFASHFSLVVRVLLLVVLVVGAIVLAAMTNQGQKRLALLKNLVQSLEKLFGQLARKRLKLH